MSTFEETLQRHVARAVPIILIENAIDEVATVKRVLEAVKADGNEDGHDFIYVWNLSQGMYVSSASVGADYKRAEVLLTECAEKEPINGYTSHPEAAMRCSQYIVDEVHRRGKDEKAGFVFFMGDRVLRPQDNDRCNVVVQILMNMRDMLKLTNSAVYMVGIDFDIPKELKEHCVVLESPLPSDMDYSLVIDECYDGYANAAMDQGKDVKPLEVEEHAQFVESLRGMSAFAAEQTVYLSTDMDGMHLEDMRQRAVQTINSTRGLTVHRGTGEGFDAIGGLHSIKEYARRLTNGKLKPKLIVYADEVEKTLAGAQGDTSGVSQNYLGTLLSEMQDTNSLGMLLTGVYGTGKSEFAKRWGEEANVLTVHLDLAGMKDSLVGNSEANLKRAMNVIKSIGGTDGGIIYLATCNRISQLPPELKRRFNLGTYFFYFPDDEEKATIWDIYRTKYGLDDVALPDSYQWTGAEIESCCRLAYLMGCSLEEAASRIVPVAKSAREEIDKLVDEANGRFLSTSKPGVFERPSAAKKAAETKGGKRNVSFN